jgi:hypothetical protein
MSNFENEVTLQLERGIHSARNISVALRNEFRAPVRRAACVTFFVENGFTDRVSGHGISARRGAERNRCLCGR